MLCLVMVLGLLPAAALADEGPEMVTTELDITKTVAQAGNVVPGAATFTFELLLGGDEDEDGTPIYERLGTATTIRGPEAARPGSGCIRNRRPGPAAPAN